jgi:hypothetical protein
MPVLWRARMIVIETFAPGRCVEAGARRIARAAAVISESIQIPLHL